MSFRFAFVRDLVTARGHLRAPAVVFAPFTWRARVLPVNGVQRCFCVDFGFDFGVAP